MAENKGEVSDIGALIGRFQVPELNQAHKQLIEKITGRHKKFLIVLDSSPTLVTRHNPLDFHARKLMIPIIPSCRLSL
jgi:hypothetical protein